MKKMQKGFTLIELLIVIAIIGILAGVILVSTSGARTKASIASVKQSMRSISAAGIICRSATPTPGEITGAAAGAALCDVPAANGGTDAVLPDITQCDGPTYAVANANADNWSITLTCPALTVCSGLVVDSSGLSTIPQACN